MNNRSLGVIALAIWAIATGVIALIPALAFPLSAVVLALLLIAAGILLLIGR